MAAGKSCGRSQGELDSEVSRDSRMLLRTRSRADNRGGQLDLT
jgi:hypothetical protein